MHQAAPTLFGHGEVFDLLNGTNRHQTAEDILSRKLEWKDSLKEVNQWVAQLRRAYDEKEIGQEADAINDLVVDEKYIKYFRNKDESTKSSPSRRHIGHYKKILADEDLVQLMVAMLNIGLQSGVALDRWKHTLSIMLEKDPGKPIDRLCVIQLFEADFNFLLALLFGHRLIGFACRHCLINESQYGSMNEKQAQSAVLNKIMLYDYFRMTKENAATA